ncbi:MAG TPA: hypothetical protein VHE55_08815 [Fimbriimonadaceae bacterium]|nr:hypothetical protein [Fimbriimonadaceae bacterium]
MATVLGPNAVITSAAADPVIDGSTSATDATTVTTATAESSGTASSSTVTDPTTGLVLEHADGADGGGGIPLSDDCWTDVSWEAKSVTLTLQADGTYVGYVSIDTNTVTMASTDTIAGEVIQIDSISLGGGI